MYLAIYFQFVYASEVCIKLNIFKLKQLHIQIKRIIRQLSQKTSVAKSVENNLRWYQNAFLNMTENENNQMHVKLCIATLGKIIPDILRKSPCPDNLRFCMFYFSLPLPPLSYIIIYIKGIWDRAWKRCLAEHPKCKDVLYSSRYR